FPLPTYAQRGPLVAWTPHLTGVAVKVDPKQPESAASAATWQRRASVGGLVGLGVLLALMVANLWATLAAGSRLATAPPPTPDTQRDQTARQSQATNPAPAPDESRERFAEALHDVLLERMGTREWEQGRTHFLAEYDRLVKKHPDLRLKESNTK